MNEPSSTSEARADAISAWATGIGVGFIVVMVTWLVGARVAERIWEAPTGPIVALSTAVLAGIVITPFAIRKFLRST